MGLENTAENDVIGDNDFQLVLNSNHNTVTGFSDFTNACLYFVECNSHLQSHSPVIIEWRTE